MSDRFKICPNCRGEYLSKAEICADCNVSLIWDKGDTLAVIPGSIEEATWGNFPPNTMLGQLTADNETVIETYIGHLKAAGIPCAVLPVTKYQPGELKTNYSPVFGTMVTGGTAGQTPVGNVVEGFEFILFAPQDNYDQATEIVEDLFADLHPGQEQGFSQEFSMDECPACGFGIKEEAGECPDCGLFFG